MFDETRSPVAPIIIVNCLFKIRVPFKLRVFSKVLFTERAPNIAFKPFLNAFVMIGMLAVELSDDILFFILLQTNRTLILLKLWMHFEVGCFQEEPFDSRIVDFCDWCITEMMGWVIKVALVSFVIGAHGTVFADCFMLL